MIRNDSCPGGPDSDFCFTPCPDGEQCIDNECVVVTCTEPNTNTRCNCLAVVGGSGGIACVQSVNESCVNECGDSSECPGDDPCVASPCCGGSIPSGRGTCVKLCGSPDPCTCEAGPATCSNADFVNCGTLVVAASRRRGERSAGSSLNPYANAATAHTTGDLPFAAGMHRWQVGEPLQTGMAPYGSANV